MSTENEIADAIEKTMADDEAKRDTAPEMEERENPFIKHFADGILRDIAGREIKAGNQKYHAALVAPASPAKKDGPGRYFVRWGRIEKKSKKSKRVKVKWEHEEYFTVGQDLEPILPGFLKEELAETAERVQPYLASGLDLAKEIPMSAQASDEIRSAILKTTDVDAVREHPEDSFATLMKLRQSEVARMEAGWRQAKMQYIRQFQDTAWHIFLSNVQMWLGCMLPIGMVTHPTGNSEDGGTALDIKLEVMPLPRTQDGQEEQDYYCASDIRWHDTDFYMALLPEMATESFYKQAARKAIGPSMDKQATLQVPGDQPTPVGMQKTAGGLIVPE